MSYQQLTETQETGQKLEYFRAAAARVKGDVVRISTGHTSGYWTDVTLADDTSVYRVAVAAQDIASGAIGAYVTAGTCVCTVPSATYTVGDGLEILDGAVAGAATAEAPTGQTTLNDFAVIKVGGTTVTSVTATLHGFPITART